MSLLIIQNISWLAATERTCNYFLNTIYRDLSQQNDNKCLFLIDFEYLSRILKNRHRYYDTYCVWCLQAMPFLNFLFFVLFSFWFFFFFWEGGGWGGGRGAYFWPSKTLNLHAVLGDSIFIIKICPFYSPPTHALHLPIICLSWANHNQI